MSSPSPAPERADDSPDAASRPRGRRRARPGPEGRERRRRMFRYALLLVSGVLMINALFGEKGYLATIQARQAEERLEDSLSALRAENQRLLNEAQRLREDPNTLEEAARGDLGLIKPGETLITIRDRERDRQDN